MTSDGYVIAGTSGGSGYEHHVLDPALASLNTAATSARVALIQHWTTGQQLYKGSVPGNTTDGGGNFAQAGMSSATTTNSFFMIDGGGNFWISEFQTQDAAGNYSAASGKAARLSATYVNTVDTANFKGSCEIYGSAGAPDTWQFLVAGQYYGDAVQPTITRVRKMELGALDMSGAGGPPPNNYGTRTAGAGGVLKDAGGSEANLFSGLVSGVGDLVKDMARNPRDGNLYFVSDYTELTNNQKHVYLSAISFAWGTLAGDSTAGYVDLDPDSANTYLEISYDSGDTNPDLLGTVGMGFSADGKILYVSNGSGTRVFIFDAVLPPEPVAEPGVLALTFLGLPLALRRRSRIDM